MVQAPQRPGVERLPPSALQALRHELTPYTFAVAFDVWDDDAVCQVVEIDERPIPARKHPTLA
jgi:hypothetical protein